MPTPCHAARFSFLLATPVILAAGVLKIPDLAGPLGADLGGPILVGSIAVYSLIVGTGALIWLTIR